jgi:hypothetical protein
VGKGVKGKRGGVRERAKAKAESSGQRKRNSEKAERMLFERNNRRKKEEGDKERSESDVRKGRLEKRDDKTNDGRC